MKPLLSLILTVLLVLIVDLCASQLGVPQSTQMRAVLSVGLLVVGAWLTGLLCERISLPAITGYLVFGILVGPSLLNLVPEQQFRMVEGGDPPLKFAGDLAIALIALIAGGEIELSWLRGRTRGILIVLAVDLMIVFLIVAALVGFVGPRTADFLPASSMTAMFVITILCAVVMIANSPSVAVAMISDFQASGPLCQMTLVLTVFKDLLLVVLFAAVMAVSKGLMDEETIISTRFLFAVALQLIGSVVTGAVIGLLMAWYVRAVGAHLAIFIVGCCLLMALIGDQHWHVFGQDVHLEPLLTALSAGLLMRNIWPETTESLFKTMETMSLPVYCLFFALAGARVDLLVFAGLWYLSLGLVAARLVAIWAGVSLGLVAAGLRQPWTRHLWLGLVPQAGVSLVLVTLITKTFADEPWTADLANLLIGAIILNQLFGPIGFRHALIRSGEAWQANSRGRVGSTPVPA